VSTAPRKKRKGRRPAPVLTGRAAAVVVLRDVIINTRRLDDALEETLRRVDDPRERALARELAIGVVRWRVRLQAILNEQLAKPLSDPELAVPLLLGLYQLEYTRIPPHAAVSSAVDAVQDLKLGRASGLVNGVLRSFQRERDRLIAKIDANSAVATGCPSWLARALEQAWPDAAQAIMLANTARAPLTLRVNLARTTVEEIEAKFADADISCERGQHAPTALLVSGASDPAVLPGFADGLISVQDEASQLATSVLAVAPGDRVLDACAAPGGKTTALAEICPTAQLVALDSDAKRLGRVRENLARTGCEAAVVHGDAGEPDTWWDGQPFDAILLDAPCSATGIIRRHPDIMARRRAEDAAQFATGQGALLEALVPLLRPGGTLVYATCSVLPEENSHTIAALLERRDDLTAQPIEASWGRESGAGRQILPGESNMDGFYYARLTRNQ
jgi:16S rRNA (cytosine967-C5)-methyltransferase